MIRRRLDSAVVWSAYGSRQLTQSVIASATAHAPSTSSLMTAMLAAQIDTRRRPVPTAPGPAPAELCRGAIPGAMGRYHSLGPRTVGSKAAGIAMAFKLIEAAQHRWRAVNAPHLVALVRAGAKFERGKLIERETPRTASEATEAA